MVDLATFKANKRAQRTTPVTVTNTLSISDMACDEATNKIKALIDECKSFIARNPSYNRNTNENRRWAGAKSMYGESVHQVIHELFTGVQRSSADHKESLLATVGLSESLINRVISSFGRPASFYLDVYQEELEYDLDTLNASLDMVEDHFDIYIDRKALAPNLVKRVFERQRDIAIKDKCNHERTVLERTQSKLLNAQAVAELAV